MAGILLDKFPNSAFRRIPGKSSHRSGRTASHMNPVGVNRERNLMKKGEKGGEGDGNDGEVSSESCRSSGR